jgi:parallel beta-helix repeat protein
VRFDGFYNIYVNGTLIAVGTEANRINITSNMTVPSNGDWFRIQINSTGHAEIKHCDISYGESGIYLSYSSNNNITGNNISYNSDGITLRSTSNDNTVANNRVYNNDDTGIYLYNSGSNHIFNNIANNNGGTGITLNTVSNINTIYKNLLYNNGFGIYLNDRCSSNNFFDNLVYNNTGLGIALYRHSNGNKVTNNTVYNNNEGIRLYTADANTIFLNRVYENNLNGIQLTHETTDGSANNKITNNSVLKNKGDGLHFTSRSNGNTIANNTIENNEDNGIYFYYSSGNTISNNSICYNTNDGVQYKFNSNSNIISENAVRDNSGYGIYIESSSNNDVYHNDIINNTNQAFDNTDKNYWNASYPSGGNYWSDFDEPGEGAYDDYNGPDQNITDRDGIVDKGLALGGGKNPYIIDFDSQDDYPLIQPYILKPLYLYQGWNLISLPTIQSNISLNPVLQSIHGKYDAVQWYNVSDQTDFWKHCHISKPPYLNDLNEITHKIGFWVHVTTSGETVFSYSGTKPTQNQTIQLHKGWNLVGYPSLSNHNRTVGLNNLTFDTYVDCIQWYDASSRTWHFMDQDDLFVPGRGYWMHSKVEAEWEVTL